MKQHLKHPVFKIVTEAASGMNVPAYVVGGFVRDVILCRQSKDIDIVVVGSGIDLAGKVAKKISEDIKIHVFKNFGTAMLKFNGYEIEFVGSRKESYRADSRKPIVENGTLEDDQKRRDFTINALAISLQKDTYGELIDPFNGINDLENKIIRTPLDPNITFSDDPLRMMRAVRFATQLNFAIDKNCLDAISRNRNRIRIVSMERITDELNKIISSPKPSIGFKILLNTGLLSLIFLQMAELQEVEVIDSQAHKDNFYHTLQVLDNLSGKTDNLWLKWAAVLHDIAKPVTKRFDKKTGWTFHGHDFKGAKMVSHIFRKFRLPSNDKMRYVQKLVLLHLRPIVLAGSEVTDSGVRRLLFDAGDDVDDLMMLCEADITSKNEYRVKRYLGNFELVRDRLKEVEEKDKIRNWKPPISGKIIMSTFGIKPSREIGVIKNAIRNAILDGEIKNDYDEAYQFMLNKGRELGLVDS